MCSFNFANPCEQPRTQPYRQDALKRGEPVSLDDEAKSSVTDKLDDFEHVNHALYSWYISVSFTSPPEEKFCSYPQERTRKDT